MGDLKLNSSGGGSVTLTTPSTASTYTQTLQAATGTVPVAAASGTFTTANFNSASTFGFKNRIINGAMVIDQRGSASTPVTSSYATDRWQNQNTISGKYNLGQSTIAPTGFTNSLVATSLSSYSVLTGDTFYFSQKIEGYNCVDLAWGTSSAAAVSLSFWARGSIAGTYGGSVFWGTTTRSYCFSYTLASNTWTYVTVPIPGDTVANTFASTTNGTAIQVSFGLGSGSTYSGAAGWSTGTFIQPTGTVSVVGTNGATLYITGIQLETGSVATGFDYRPYGTELMLCQRYCQVINGSNNYRMAGQFYTTTAGRVVLIHYVTMRSAPTLTVSGSTGEAVGVGTTTFTTNNANQVLGVDASSWDLTGATAARTAYQQLIYTGTATLSAEL